MSIVASCTILLFSLENVFKWQTNRIIVRCAAINKNQFHQISSVSIRSLLNSFRQTCTQTHFKTDVSSLFVGLIFTYHNLTNINKQWQHSSNSSISTAICRHMIISDGIEVYKCAPPPPRVFMCYGFPTLHSMSNLYLFIHITYRFESTKASVVTYAVVWFCFYLACLFLCAVKECISLVAAVSALVCLENLESFAHGYYPLAQTATERKKKTRENRRDIERS